MKFGFVGALIMGDIVGTTGRSENWALVCELSASITALPKIYHEGLNCRTLTIDTISVNIERQCYRIESAVRLIALSQRSE